MPPRDTAAFHVEELKPCAQVDITFMCKGFVDTLPNVDASARVSVLREPLVSKIEQLFGVTLRPPELRLRTLVQDGDKWPLEEDASSAASRPIKVTNKIATEFPGAGAEGEVQLLVDFTEPAPLETRQLDTEVMPPPVVAVGSDGDVEDAATSFNDGCVKVVGAKRRLSEHDEPERLEFKNMAFSDFTETRTKRVFRGIEATDYVQESTPLPPKLEAGIREAAHQVRRRGKHSKPDQGEAVSSSRVHDREQGLLATGSADWVVTRGKRMLVVIEAKQSNIKQGQYQLMAMMEAARIQNKRLDKNLDSIKAIITDFQNWMFVERSTGLLKKEELGAAIPVDKEAFPDTLIPICERVYHVLLNL
ncbi:unnamed protein product [Phytophthora fragariaefolia]|uniref:Unnamed protein product n=1 Tax=Phytophthora fragariaefolia TaxID=1490495 RepID=A0A9W6U7Z5_9STRA|nr:unnamed protein product [Phytophthora fragariaefolia]